MGAFEQHSNIQKFKIGDGLGPWSEMAHSSQSEQPDSNPETSVDYVVSGISDAELFKSVGAVDVIEELVGRTVEKGFPEYAAASDSMPGLLVQIQNRMAAARVAAERVDEQEPLYSYGEGSLVPRRPGFWGWVWHEVNKKA